MGTSLGDATIRVALDPRLAKEELDKLSQEIEKIDRAKQDQMKEIDQWTRNQGREPGQQNTEQSSVRNRGSIRGIADVFSRIAGPVQTATQVAEQILPILGTAVQVAMKGTIAEEVGRTINEKIQAIADEFSKFGAGVEAVKGTAEQAVQFNIAALRLGGKFPDDQDVLLSQIYKITSAQEELRRNLNRDINNSTVESIINGAKALMEGGK